MNGKWKIWAWILTPVILLGLVGAAYVGTMLHGTNVEIELGGRFQANQDVLSTCNLKVKEQVQVTSEQTRQFAEAMDRAIQGRYDGKAAPAAGGGQLFSAIVEEYPDLKGMKEPFDRLAGHMAECRERFSTAQRALIDQRVAYDKFRRSLFVRVFSNFGLEFPSHDLTAKIGPKEYYAQDAYNHIKTILQEQQSVKDFEDKVIEVPQHFGTPTPAPTRSN